MKRIIIICCILILMCCPVSFGEMTTNDITQVAVNTIVNKLNDSFETFEDTIKFPQYSSEDLNVLARIINGEACGESWESKIGVGSVVLNRVNSDRFPNTISAVAFQSGQYACTWDGNYAKTPTEESINAAKYLLTYGSQFPVNVVFQAQFKQGHGVYKHIGNTYFCYL